MSATNDGGPAFPGPHFRYLNGEVLFGAPGMTLRDYAEVHFTSAWIVALGARQGQPGYSDEAAAWNAAKLGREQADAMLAARSSAGPCNAAMAERAYIIDDPMLSARTPRSTP